MLALHTVHCNKAANRLAPKEAHPRQGRPCYPMHMHTGRRRRRSCFVVGGVVLSMRLAPAQHWHRQLLARLRLHIAPGQHGSCRSPWPCHPALWLPAALLPVHAAAASEPRRLCWPFLHERTGAWVWAKKICGRCSKSPPRSCSCIFCRRMMRCTHRYARAIPVLPLRLA